MNHNFITIAEFREEYDLEDEANALVKLVGLTEASRFAMYDEDGFLEEYEAVLASVGVSNDVFLDSDGVLEAHGFVYLGNVEAGKYDMTLHFYRKGDVIFVHSTGMEWCPACVYLLAPVEA